MDDETAVERCAVHFTVEAPSAARWDSVANFNKVRDDLKNEILLRLAPIVLSLLAGLVGL